MLEGRLVDEASTEVFNSDASYYALLAPNLIPVLILFHFLIWFGFEFFIHN